MVPAPRPAASNDRAAGDPKGGRTMADRINRRIVMTARPEGAPKDSDFRLEETAVPEPGAGVMLCRTLYLSLDPYMRGRMSAAKSYAAPTEIGQVMEGGAVSEVLHSNAEEFEPGDIVFAYSGWQDYWTSDGKGARKLDPDQAPVSTALGVLGMPGMTAYVGLHKIAEAQAEDNVFVSAASGAVGSVVGQLAKIHGCRVAGCAGSDDKVALLTDELKFDAAFNYRSSKSLPGSMAEVCPAGIDVNFENVGGEIFEAALWNMRDFGRVALCGMISNYNDKQLQPGPRGMTVIIGRRLRIQGFIVTDHPEACQEYAVKAAGWLAEGKLQYRETVAEGIENAPAAFISMLKGGNTGKQIVQLSAA